MASTVGVGAADPSMGGHLFFPGDDRWDEVRAAWNLAFDQRPAAVSLPRSAEEIAALVTYARAHGLRIAAQGTGHGAGALESLEGALLVKTTEMRGVTVDPVARTARVEAGALWEDVATAVDPHDLACLSGSSPDVGVVGYTLGGGLSWLARTHGLSCNNVRAIEVVLADGRHRRVTADNDPELFWAMRGGGGSFGVVTAIELELLPISEVYAGILFWPWERSAEILRAWRDWTTTVPDAMTSVGRILQLPPIPEVPEPLQGRAFAVIEVILIGDEAEGQRLVAPLRAMGPEMDTVAVTRPVELTALHMDPPQPVPAFVGERMLTALPDEPLDALLSLAGPDSGSPLLSVELRHLGGALRRPGPDHGALAGFDAEYLMCSIGMPMGGPDHAAAIIARNEELAAALSPWADDRSYLNFVERPTDAAALFTPEAHARLRAVKAAYDPDDVFLSNHPIRPAEPAAP